MTEFLCWFGLACFCVSGVQWTLASCCRSEARALANRAAAELARVRALNDATRDLLDPVRPRERP